MAALTVTQRKSRNGANQKQLDTLRSLGLRRIGHTVRSRTLSRRAACCTRSATWSRSTRASVSPADEEKQQRIGLHSLAPAPGSRRPRKRIGRGEGSGTGKTSGRGQKGAGSRSGSKRRARFEGGQMPIHMRMRKLRGPHMKKSMPFEPFRTHTQPVNIGGARGALRGGHRGDDRADARPTASARARTSRSRCSPRASSARR